MELTIQNPEKFDEWWKNHRETNMIIRLEGIENIVKAYDKWLKQQ